MIRLCKGVGVTLKQKKSQGNERKIDRETINMHTLHSSQGLASTRSEIHHKYNIK